MQQFGFRALRPVVGEFGLVRGTPPRGAAAANRYQAHATARAKCLRKQVARGMIADAAPALITTINRFSVTDQLRADSGTESICTDQNITRRRATAGKMRRHAVTGLFEMDELFARIHAVWRQRRKERLLQFGAVQTNGRHVREIGGHTRERDAAGSRAHGGLDDRAAIHHLLHQAQMLQHAHRVRRKDDASADFLQFRSALKNLDTHTHSPQGNGGSESANPRADDENFRLCRHN